MLCTELFGGSSLLLYAPTRVIKPKHTHDDDHRHDDGGHVDADDGDNDGDDDGGDGGNG